MRKGKQGGRCEIPSREEFQRRLGGELHGDQLRCPGQGHSPGDLSLSIKFGTEFPEGVICYSFAGDDPIVWREYVRQCLGLEDWRPDPLGSLRNRDHKWRGGSNPTMIRTDELRLRLLFGTPRLIRAAPPVASLPKGSPARWRTQMRGHGLVSILCRGGEARAAISRMTGRRGRTSHDRASLDSEMRRVPRIPCVRFCCLYALGRSEKHSCCGSAEDRDEKPPPRLRRVAVYRHIFCPPWLSRRSLRVRPRARSGQHLSIDLCRFAPHT